MSNRTISPLFAKQPIYDVNLNLYGYEILYRDSEQNVANFLNPENATRSLLMNFCAGLFENDPDAYVKIFTNLTRELILSDIFLPLPTDRVVIEIVEETLIDDLLLIRISELKHQGFKFAIDDYKPWMNIKEVLPLIDYIKVDILDSHDPQIKSIFADLKKSIGDKKSPVLLAEKVETKEVFSTCLAAGAMLFQGYFLKRPEIIYGRKIETSSRMALKLISVLQQEHASIEYISELASQDIGLSYQLIKLVNSPVCRLPRKIDSIKEAIVYLGMKVLKKWTMIIALTSSNKGNIELLRILLERAKLCELIAESQNPQLTDASFIVGLFSGIDLVLEADKEWLLEKLGLSDEITRAILLHAGALGEILRLSESIESSDIEKLDRLDPFQAEQISTLSIQSHQWTGDVLRHIF